MPESMNTYDYFSPSRNLSLSSHKKCHVPGSQKCVMRTRNDKKCVMRMRNDEKCVMRMRNDEKCVMRMRNDEKRIMNTMRKAGKGIIIMKKLCWLQLPVFSLVNFVHDSMTQNFLACDSYVVIVVGIITKYMRKALKQISVIPELWWHLWLLLLS